MEKRQSNQDAVPVFYGCVYYPSLTLKVVSIYLFHLWKMLKKGYVHIVQQNHQSISFTSSPCPSFPCLNSSLPFSLHHQQAQRPQFLIIPLTLPNLFSFQTSLSRFLPPCPLTHNIWICALSDISYSSLPGSFLFL